MKSLTRYLILNKLNARDLKAGFQMIPARKMESLCLRLF